MPRYRFRYTEDVPYQSDFILTAENKGEAQAKARRAIDDGVYNRLWQRGFMETLIGSVSTNKKRVEFLEEVSANFKDHFAPVLRIKED